MPRDSKLVQEFRQRLENLEFEASDEKLNTLDRLGDEQKALMQLAMEVAYEQDADDDLANASVTKIPVKIKDGVVDAWFKEDTETKRDVFVEVPDDVQEQGGDAVIDFVETFIEENYSPILDWGYTQTW